MSKRLGGIKKAANTKPLHGIQTDSPMQITLGQQCNFGEKPALTESSFTALQSVIFQNCSAPVSTPEIV